jgi:Pantoate-beta-alanine ligase
MPVTFLLSKRARIAVDVVVVSLFVIQSRFNESSDLDQYPRDEAGDIRLLTSEGADLLFAPVPDEMYPGDFSTAGWAPVGSWLWLRTDSGWDRLRLKFSPRRPALHPQCAITRATSVSARR